MAKQVKNKNAGLISAENSTEFLQKTEKLKKNKESILKEIEKQINNERETIKKLANEAKASLESQMTALNEAKEWGELWKDAKKEDIEQIEEEIKKINKKLLELEKIYKKIEDELVDILVDHLNEDLEILSKKVGRALDKNLVTVESDPVKKFNVLFEEMEGMNVDGGADAVLAKLKEFDERLKTQKQEFDRLFPESETKPEGEDMKPKIKIVADSQDTIPKVQEQPPATDVVPAAAPQDNVTASVEAGAVSASAEQKPDFSSFKGVKAGVSAVKDEKPSVDIGVIGNIIDNVSAEQAGSSVAPSPVRGGTEPARNALASEAGGGGVGKVEQAEQKSREEEQNKLILWDFKYQMDQNADLKGVWKNFEKQLSDLRISKKISSERFKNIKTAAEEMKNIEEEAREKARQEKIANLQKVFDEELAKEGAGIKKLMDNLSNGLKEQGLKYKEQLEILKLAREKIGKKEKEERERKIAEKRKKEADSRAGQFADIFKRAEKIGYKSDILEKLKTNTEELADFKGDNGEWHKKISESNDLFHQVIAEVKTEGEKIHEILEKADKRRIKKEETLKEIKELLQKDGKRDEAKVKEILTDIEEDLRYRAFDQKEGKKKQMERKQQEMKKDAPPADAAPDITPPPVSEVSASLEPQPNAPPDLAAAVAAADKAMNEKNETIPIETPTHPHPAQAGNEMAAPAIKADAEMDAKKEREKQDWEKMKEDIKEEHEEWKKDVIENGYKGQDWAELERIVEKILKIENKTIAQDLLKERREKKEDVYSNIRNFALEKVKEKFQREKDKEAKAEFDKNREAARKQIEDLLARAEKAGYKNVANGVDILETLKKDTEEMMKENDIKKAKGLFNKLEGVYIKVLSEVGKAEKKSAKAPAPKAAEVGGKKIEKKAASINITEETSVLSSEFDALEKWINENGEDAKVLWDGEENKKNGLKHLRNDFSSLIILYSELNNRIANGATEKQLEEEKQGIDLLRSGLKKKIDLLKHQKEEIKKSRQAAEAKAKQQSAGSNPAIPDAKTAAAGPVETAAQKQQREKEEKRLAKERKEEEKSKETLEKLRGSYLKEAEELIKEEKDGLVKEALLAVKGELEKLVFTGRADKIENERRMIDSFKGKLLEARKLKYPEKLKKSLEIELTMLRDLWKMMKGSAGKKKKIDGELRKLERDIKEMWEKPKMADLTWHQQNIEEMHERVVELEAKIQESGKPERRPIKLENPAAILEERFDIAYDNYQALRREAEILECDKDMKELKELREIVAFGHITTIDKATVEKMEEKVRALQAKLKEKEDELKTAETEKIEVEKWKQKIQKIKDDFKAKVEDQMPSGYLDEAKHKENLKKLREYLGQLDNFKKESEAGDLPRNAITLTNDIYGSITRYLARTPDAVLPNAPAGTTPATPAEAEPVSPPPLPRGAEGGLPSSPEAEAETKMTLSSLLIAEILRGREEDVKRVVAKLFEGMVARGNEPNQLAAMELRQLFKSEPEPELMEKIKRSGIKDWKQFQKMWEDGGAEQTANVLNVWVSEAYKEMVIMNANLLENAWTSLKQGWAVKGEMAKRILSISCFSGVGAWGAGAIFGHVAGGGLEAGLDAAKGGVGTAGGATGGFFRGILNRYFGGKRKEQMAEKARAAGDKRTKELMVKNKDRVTKEFLKNFFGDDEGGEEKAMGKFSSILAGSLRKMELNKAGKAAFKQKEAGVIKTTALEGEARRMYFEILRQNKLSGAEEPSESDKTALAMALYKLQENEAKASAEGSKKSEKWQVKVLDGLMKAYGGRVAEGNKGWKAATLGVTVSTVVGAGVGYALTAAGGWSQVVRGTMGGVAGGLAGYRLGEASVAKSVEKRVFRRFEDIVLPDSKNKLKNFIVDSAKAPDEDPDKEETRKQGLESTKEQLLARAEEFKLLLKGGGTEELPMELAAAIKKNPLVRAEVEDFIHEVENNPAFGEKTFEDWHTALQRLAAKSETAEKELKKKIKAKRGGWDWVRHGSFTVVGAVAGAGVGLLVGRGVQKLREALGLSPVATEHKAGGAAPAPEVGGEAAHEASGTSVEPEHEVTGEVTIGEGEFKRMEIVTVHKGQGITQATMDALKEHPEKFGYDKAHDGNLNHWAREKSIELAKEAGYIKEDGAEIRIREQEGGAKYNLIQEENGEWHLQAPKGDQTLEYDVTGAKARAQYAEMRAEKSGAGITEGHPTAGANEVPVSLKNSAGGTIANYNLHTGVTGLPTQQGIAQRVLEAAEATKTSAQIVQPSVDATMDSAEAVRVVPPALKGSVGGAAHEAVDAGERVASKILPPDAVSEAGGKAHEAVENVTDVNLQEVNVNAGNWSSEVGIKALHKIIDDGRWTGAEKTDLEKWMTFFKMNKEIAGKSGAGLDEMVKEKLGDVGKHFVHMDKMKGLETNWLSTQKEALSEFLKGVKGGNGYGTILDNLEGAGIKEKYFGIVEQLKPEQDYTTDGWRVDRGDIKDEIFKDWEEKAGKTDTSDKGDWVKWEDRVKP